MSMTFNKKLPMPAEVKNLYPMTANAIETRDNRRLELKSIFDGNSDKFVLIVGPCSVDNYSATIDYISRLSKLNEQVKDKLFIVPRVYTSKPRTKGVGYKGMLHQPDPKSNADLFNGILNVRNLHLTILRDYGFICADELLYPDNHRYISDLLGYVAVGARSVENQQHRLLASGLSIPVGMKNPLSGNISSMLDAVYAAQQSHTFIYRGWEVTSEGNPYAHTILRGYMDYNGHNRPNYDYEILSNLVSLYKDAQLKNHAAIIDLNHSNSNKNCYEQPRIADNVMQSMRLNKSIQKLIKGFMIESYIEDGSQSICDEIYGKSITDPCLGWSKTEKLILTIADKLN